MKATFAFAIRCRIVGMENCMLRVRRSACASVPISVNIQYSSGSPVLPMNIAVVIVLMLAGVVIGAGFAWLLAGPRSSALAERKSELEQELASARIQLAQAQSDNASLLAAKAGFEATLESERRNVAEKLRLKADDSEETQGAVRSAGIFRAERATMPVFCSLPRAHCRNTRSEARGELDKRETGSRDAG